MEKRDLTRKQGPWDETPRNTLKHDEMTCFTMNTVCTDFCLKQTRDGSGKEFGEAILVAIRPRMDI